MKGLKRELYKKLLRGTYKRPNPPTRSRFNYGCSKQSDLITGSKRATTQQFGAKEIKPQNSIFQGNRKELRSRGRR